MRDATPPRPGSFCWPELATRDAAAAKGVYGGLFGWSCRDAPVRPGEEYAIFELAGREAAAVTTAPRGERAGTSRWRSYVAVADVDACITRATSLGGELLAGPVDVGAKGRMAVLRDPQGAGLSIWEAKAHPGIGVEGEVGSLCWTELATTDVAAAVRFYRGLFDWTIRKSAGGDYTEVAAGGTFVAGILAMGRDWGDTAPAWSPYFRVGDCDVTGAEARADGARILAGPSDLPHLGRYALLADPQGATFAVISFEEAA